MVFPAFTPISMIADFKKEKKKDSCCVRDLIFFNVIEIEIFQPNS